MKKLLLPVAIIASLCFPNCGNSVEKKHDVMPDADTSKGVSAMVNDSVHLAYICPCGGCSDVKESKPGKCPKCEMDLVAEKK